jgi:hypothetical protein
MAGGAIVALSPLETLLGGGFSGESHDRLRETVALYGSELGAVKIV